MKKLIYILFLLIISIGSKCQSDTSSIFSFSIQPGFKMTNTKDANPFFGSSIQYLLNTKISEDFEFSTGIDFSTYKFYSKPFYNSYTYWGHYHVGGGGVVMTSNTVIDDFESVTFYHEKYISVPFLFKYAPTKKKITPQASVGFLFSLPYFSDKQTMKYSELLDTVFYYSLDNYKDHYASPNIFIVSNLGCAINFNNTVLSLGMEFSHSLIPESNRYSYGINLGLKNRISPNKFPHRLDPEPDSVRKKHRNFVYVELFGNALLYSFNYEGTVYQKNNFSFNARIGVMLLPMPYGSYYQDQNKYFLPQIIPIGINTTFGNMNKLELGIGYTFMLIDSGSDNPVVFSLGYRHESKRNNFFRFVLTPFMDEGINGRIFPWAGISFGRKF